MDTEFDFCVGQMFIHTTRKGENSSGPLGSRVFNKKVDLIYEHSDPVKHELFFDNFFAIYNLLADR